MSFRTNYPKLTAYFKSVSRLNKLNPLKKFFVIRAGFSLLLLGGVLTAGFVVGAQKILRKPVLTEKTALLGEKSKGKKFDNADIRVNFKNNLGQINEVTALARSGKFNAVSEKTNSYAASINDGLANLKTAHPSVKAQISDLTGAIEIVQSNDGLTAANPGRSGEAIVREFITNHQNLYGLKDSEIDNLHFIGESVSPANGLRMVRVEQLVNNRPVFQSESRFILNNDGQIVESLGLMIPDAEADASPLENLLSPQTALRLTAAQFDVQLDENQMSVGEGSDDAKTILNAGNHDLITDNVTSKLVYFPVGPGILIPAWSQIIFTPDADFYVLVDARNGTLLWRKNIRDYASTQQARFRVYVQADGKTPADSPAPQSPNTVAPGSGTQFPEIAPTIVNMSAVQDITASPNGWIDDCPAGGCTANETQTLGNNTLTCMDATGTANVCDTAASTVLDGNGRPTGNPDANARNRDFLGTTPRDFQTNYLPPPQGGNPEAGQTATGMGTSGTAPVDQFRRGMVTHLFYLTNWYHDQLYQLGFNEAAGNFQNTNFSGQGLGGDRVLGDAQDSSGTDNANFSTPPDGSSGRMQMYRFTGPTIDRDGALDAEIVLHELTHGTSNRLVGNGAGLLWDEARGMGEGWSDFYALSLINNTNADNPNGRYASGAYATYKLSGLAFTDNYVYGIRRFPYATDNTVNPMTWADVDDVTNNLSGGIAPTPVSFNANGGMEVHNSGEIWADTLWEVRSRVIADPAGANGDVPTGTKKALQIVTDGLKMTPINPSFADARDAILNADCATNACANENSIWGGFADRGFGYKAVAPNKFLGRYVRGHQGFGESFSSPYLDVVNSATDVTVTGGNSNGAIDPGETVTMTVKLTNPWRGAGKAVTTAAATLTTTTPGVTVTNGNAVYGAIAPQGSATGTPFIINANTNLACGQSVNFTIQTTSMLGTTVSNFTVRIGLPQGTDPVVTYTSGPNLNLTIANNTPRGTINSLNVPDDYQIADLNFRVDSITHPGVGDLTVMLRGPNGYGNDFISLIDGLNDLGGTSITNMVIDDDVASSAATDMVQATTVDAPYSKSWLPVYNAPWAALVNPAVPDDPNGQLNPYNGLSTKGTWSVDVADVFSAAAGGTDGNGTLNGWSLQITPVHFACRTPTAAGASVSGAVKSSAGKFVSGARVTLKEQNGTSQTVTTNAFGRFKFDEIATGQTIIVSVAAKSYRFSPQAISLNNNLTGINFIAR